MSGDGSLIAVLKRMGRRLRLVADVRGLGWGLAAASGLVVATAWCDLLTELPSGVRTWALCLSGFSCLVTILLLAVGGWRSSRSDRVARLVDRIAETGGEVVTGLDLHRSGEAARPVTEGLRRLAVRRAGEAAGSVAVPTVAPLRGAGRPFACLLLMTACVAGLALLAPRLVRTQVVRTLTPWLDEPPYSPYEFQVDPGDAQVLFGGTVDVYVRFGEVKPEQLELVVQDARSGTGDAGAGAGLLGQDNGAASHPLLRLLGMGGDRAVPSPGEMEEGQHEEDLPGDRRSEVLPMFPERSGAWRGQLRDLTVPVTYLVRAPRGRTRSYHVDLIYTPRLTNVAFRVTPPAYTGLPRRQGPLPEQGLSGLVDTVVECTAESNRPLSGGDLQLEWQDGGSEAVILTPTAAGARTVRGSFVITGSGRFTVGVVDVDGLAGRTRMSGAVTLLEDKRPFVRVVQPLPSSFATPTVRLPVVVEADDDFGLTRLWLYRSLNDSRDLPLELLGPGDAAPRARAVVELPLDRYGLAPNDVLTFYARVQDNDPNQPKGAESELVRVRIISEEDFDRLTRARATLDDLLTKYASHARALEALRERLEDDLKALKALDPGSEEAAAALRRELGELRAALAEEARRAREHAARTPLFDLDEYLSHTLDDLANAAEEAAGRVAKAAGATRPASMLEHLGEAKRLLGGGAEQYAAEAMEPLEMLEAVYPLIEDAARFVALYARQKDLARRMQSLAGSEDVLSTEAKVRARDLSDEEAALEERLGDLLSDIRAHELVCPDEEPYQELKRSSRDFVEAVGASGAQEEMRAVRTSLAEPDAETAARHSAKAERILSAFIARSCGMEGMAGQAATALTFQPCLAQGMGNTLKQLLAAAGLGLVPGSNVGLTGFGAAGMGGYGIFASTLSNVGLYGASEVGSPLTGPGDMDFNNPVINVEVSRDHGGDSGLVTVQEDVVSSAGLLQTVPPEYLKRVQEYFRRVAEETSGHGNSPRRSPYREEAVDDEEEDAARP